MPANPEAIAWYLQRSEALLDDLRDRVRWLRTRGGQLAGFSGAVLALVGSLVTALRGTPERRAVPDLSAEEVANYTSERFVQEPDLWRVQMRTIRSLRGAIELTTRQRDQVARAVGKAEYLFLSGLCSVGLTLAILIAEVTF